MKKIFFLFLGLMIVGLLFNTLWDKVPAVKSAVNTILNPILGKILSWNLTWGYVIIIGLLQFILTIIQKYTTDQEALKKLREEQKAMQEEMKKYAPNDPKSKELRDQQFANMPKNFELVMKPLIYTALPIILLFRWFTDTFKGFNDPKFFGLMGWFGTYFVLSIIFSMIFRKVLKVY